MEELLVGSICLNLIALSFPSFIHWMFYYLTESMCLIVIDTLISLVFQIILW